MKNKIIFIILFIIAAFLSWQITSFEFILLALFGLMVIFLIPAGVVSLFKKVNSKFIIVPLAVIVICLAGNMASLFRPYDEAILNTGDLKEQLEYAYKTDQKDRMQLKSYALEDLKARDTMRLQQVNEILEEEMHLNPIDKFHAAFILHHSDNSKDYKRASELANAAAKAPELHDHYQVQWLKKAAYDRYMLSIGKLEKYGTQNKFSIGVE